MVPKDPGNAHLKQSALCGMQNEHWAWSVGELG